MKVKEQGLVFECAGEQLIGVLAQPETAREIGVVLVVGGPQYRVGSHRQFLLLARALAAAGFPVLRFDYRGMGDSSGALRDFEDVGPDIAAAVDALLAHSPGVGKVALWGLCDAASAALMYCQERRDVRLAGICLLNPWVRSAATLARTRVKHYYVKRLMQPAFWKKLFSGKVAGKALRDLADNVRLARADAGAPAQAKLSFQQRMAAGWRDFPGQRLLILSGDDHTAKEFLESVAADPAWSGALDCPHRRHDLASADHTFSSAEWRAQVESWTVNWLQELAAT